MAEPASQQSVDQQPGTYVCPECGRSFSRPQALGAHRSRAHGVAGTSRSARGQKRTTKARTRTTPAKTRSSTRAGRPSTRRRSSGGSSNALPKGLDRDGLLAALFPNGIPPREDVIRAVNVWLDEADRLRALS